MVDYTGNVGDTYVKMLIAADAFDAKGVEI
jgi:hypothetical protein